MGRPRTAVGGIITKSDIKGLKCIILLGIFDGLVLANDE